MTGNGNSFVEWKEEFISQERGHRVVHYFLKDSTGEFILAVVGTERSVRHMFYVVAEEFVRAYGAENAIHAGFKWRSRREVVDWLTSMLSKQHRQGDWSKSPKRDWAQAVELLDSQVNEHGAHQSQNHLHRNLHGQTSDIVWSGVAWTCGKQLKHYPAFNRNGTKIVIQSFVFVMAKGQNHYLAYLEDMYEDKRGQKKVKVRWFHHDQEVKGVVPLRNSHPKEVFITPYSQVISAECVDGPATVLTREHFEDCAAALPCSLSRKVHMCFRQFRSNKIKPFDLTKLRGYFDQPILCYLNSNPLPGADSLHGGANEENEEYSQGENRKLGSKKPSSGMWENYVKDQSELISYKTSYPNPRYCLSGKRLLSLKQRQKPFLQVDEKIELLCQDSGIRGCWFRCTVLQVSRKQIKVQYDDVQDEDEYGNLEEWVPAFRIAESDKLGIRCSGRQTIRPPLPPNDPADLALDVGSAVDAWWSDGWWEGVVTGTPSSSDDTLPIYFPGEKFFLNVHRKDLRVSRDWVGGQWIDIQRKPGILSAISERVSPEANKSMSAEVGVKSDCLDKIAVDVPENTKLGNIKEEEPDTVMEELASYDCVMEEADVVVDGKPPPADPASGCSNNTDRCDNSGNGVQLKDENVADVHVESDCKDIEMEVNESDRRALELMAVRA